jgi:glutamate racemase
MTTRTDTLAPTIPHAATHQCVGVFDSGLGGLSVLRVLCGTLPGVRWLYVADSGHAPYGERSEAHVLDRSDRITRFLRDRGARTVVLACNTATAVAIDALRARHRDLSFVGMEPGLKPALQHSARARVGVMATEATLRSPRFAALLARWRGQAEVVCVPCAGLAHAIESGDTDAPAVRALVARYTAPLRAQAVDTVVLGCTHYPWVAPLIQDALGPEVRLIDTAQAVAAQTARVLSDAKAFIGEPSRLHVQAYTSGDSHTLQQFARQRLPALQWQVARLPV